MKNGTLATIDKIRGNIITVRLDGPIDHRIAFDVREYNHLDHGYAVTAHKAQGITADRAHVLASDLFDQHVAYVALSRHRKQVDLHWSRDTFQDRNHMVRQLSRERMKDIALDHVNVERDNRALHAQAERQVEQRQPERQHHPEVARPAVAPRESPAHGAPVAGVAKAKEPMTPKELAKLRKDVVDLERAAKADPTRAKDLRAAQKAYDFADDEMKQQRKARAQEIKKDRGPGFGKGFGLGDD